MSLFVKSLFSIFLVSKLDGIPLCSVHTMDSVFNLGHYIYLLRCGEMWTVDTRRDNGNGLLIKDSSPLTIASLYFGALIQHKHKSFDRKLLNFSGFSIQELSCDNHVEDAIKTCQKNIDRYQHLTVFFTQEYSIQFRYQSQYIPLNESLISNKFMENIAYPVNTFWPWIKEVAPGYHFEQSDSRFVAALYDFTTFNMFLVLNHIEYNCITYANLKYHIYTLSTEKSYRTPLWTRAYCFIGHVIGMFLYKNQTYIAGQVLLENRMYEDQVYRIYARGESKIDIEAVFVESNGKRRPQNLRTLFGCSPDYIPKSSYE